MMKVSWEGAIRRRMPMKKRRLSPHPSAALTILIFITGAVLGAAWALRLNEEQQRRIKKNLFELREMPFRVFI